MSQNMQSQARADNLQKVEESYYKTAKILSSWWHSNLSRLTQYNWDLKEEITTQIIQLVKIFPSLELEELPFYRSHIFKDTLLVIKGCLPIVKNNAVISNVQINLKLVKEFPECAPDVKIVGNTQLPYIDESIEVQDGQVKSEYQRNWKLWKSNLVDLCKHLVICMGDQSFATVSQSTQTPTLTLLNLGSKNFTSESIALQEKTENMQPARKLALIVGNNDYKGDLDPLFNCVRDAELVNKTLQKLQFNTTLITNCTNDEFVLAVRRFTGTLQDKDIVFFYFAGHAGQQNNQNVTENYLFGVDAYYKKLGQKKVMEGVKLNRDIINQFDAYCIYLIVLDACRLYPNQDRLFRGDSGNSVDMQSLMENSWERTLAPFQLPENVGRSQYDVVFACEPGKFAIEDKEEQHGHLARYLSKSLSENEFWDDILIRTKQGVFQQSRGRQCPCVLTQLRVKLNLQNVFKAKE